MEKKHPGLVSGSESTHCQHGRRRTTKTFIHLTFKFEQLPRCCIRVLDLMLYEGTSEGGRTG